MRSVICLLLFMLTLSGCGQHAAVKGKKPVQNDSLRTQEPEPKTGREKRDSYIDSIGTLPPQISKFIPDNYLPLDTATGDLNLDGINDMLLVLKKKGEDSLSDFANGHEEKRPLLILLGQTDGSYIQARRNDNVVMCVDCGGVMVSSDPFAALVIKNGYFSVEHGMSEGPQHWETVTTFKYDKDKQEWFLFKDGAVYYEMKDDPDNMEAHRHIKTQKDFGIVPFEKYEGKK